MPTTIKVSIARLGTSIQEVELDVGASAMDALRSAGYDMDAVNTIKRNGSIISLDAQLDNGDVLMVSVEKIKWGTDQEEVVEPNLIKLYFDIKRESEAKGKAPLAFTDDMDTFQIVKQVLHNKGISLNSLKELQDTAGNKISLSEKLEDEGEYVIVLIDVKVTSCNNDEDDDY